MRIDVRLPILCLGVSLVGSAAAAPPADLPSPPPAVVKTVGDLPDSRSFLSPLIVAGDGDLALDGELNPERRTTVGLFQRLRHPRASSYPRLSAVEAGRIVEALAEWATNAALAEQSRRLAGLLANAREADSLAIVRMTHAYTDVGRTWQYICVAAEVHTFSADGVGLSRTEHHFCNPAQRVLAARGSVDRREMVDEAVYRLALDIAAVYLRPMAPGAGTAAAQAAAIPPSSGRPTH